MERRFGERSFGESTSVAGANNFGQSRRFGGTSVYTRKEKALTAEELLENDKNLALEPFDPEKLPLTFMYVSVSGVVQSGSVSN